MNTIPTEDGMGRPSSLRVLIVTPDIHGPIRNGGIGTAFSALAIWLARWGHEASVLYALGNHSEGEPIEDWVRRYSGLGVRLIPLDEGTSDGLPELDAPHFLGIAWRVHAWLKVHSTEFDICVFPEWMGLAHYVLLAKGQGLAYRHLAIVVNTHSPESWASEGNRALPDSLDVLDRDFMERESVRRADYVISPSEYMLRWMRQRQWIVPDAWEVIQNLLSDVAEPDQERGGVGEIQEIVFFGRLETRKGLSIFCDAIDRVLPEIRYRLKRVCFLGKAVDTRSFSSRAYIGERGRKWGVRTEILDGRDREQALTELRRPGLIAIIASLAENSPYTVLECLHHRIPFLATRVGGIPELIHPGDHDACLFEPNPGALSARITAVVQQGARLARMALSQEETRLRWRDWFERIRVLRYNTPVVSPILASEVLPKVSVCLVHYNRPKLLAQALESLRRQTYSQMEVVLVDDGSPSEESRKSLDALESEFKDRDWQLIRQPNRYLGAARNRAAERARGEYLLFMDDDNIALPHQVETFVKAARNSGADVLTCVMQPFRGEHPPAQPSWLWLFLGGAAGAGLYSNVFGDANALWRRQAFMGLGGYTTDYGVGHEDWELFSEAVLSGLRLELVPEPLFWYRVNQRGMLRGGNSWADYARSVRPYVRHDPLGCGMALAYAVWLRKKREEELLKGAWSFRRFANAVRLAVDPAKRARFMGAVRRHGVLKAMKRGWARTGS